MSADRMKVVVSRGDRFDVAEWAPGEPGFFGSRGPDPSAPSQSAPIVFAAIATLAILIGTVLMIQRAQPAALGKPLVPTVADLQAVHAGVSAAGAPVRKIRRLAAGDAVETDADGRARLRLDDGTTLVLDRATKLVLRDKGLVLERGRLFVQAALGARTEIDLGAATAILSGANAGIERPKESPDGAKVYVATAEITMRAGSAEQTVRAGETATVAGGKVTVAPERGYDDWTYGMASPWAARGAPRRAVGELWGRPTSATAGADAAGSPLTIRAHDVRATVTREVAETEVRTTFFNAGSDLVTGDYRMAVPPGAIVSRFATIRGDRTTEGKIALAARKAQAQAAMAGSSEVLEWAGEGWLRATVPGIAAGATVTLVVGYVEWLSPQPKADGQSLIVQYRYPMVSDAVSPLIGEFSARVDAAPSSPISIASGLGARVSGQAVEVRRPDFRPSADLVVDVEIPPFKAPARIYAAPPTSADDAGGTVVVRTETPHAAGKAADTAGQEGVTLALVMDTSASIEPALLKAEQALVEAVMQGLGPRDRAVVLAADQGVRPVGPAAVGPVDAERRKAVSAALDKLSPGGASDLGRALEAGADALPADAPAAMVIYIGDGWPTMGDAVVDAMKARLARRPGGAPRLGAVAVGPLCNLFALNALVRGSGPLLEIADAGDAARTAIALIAEALQPTVAGVEIDFGPEVERIYPRGPRAIVAGETVTATGRVRGDLPTEITLRWRDDKGAHEEKRPLSVELAPSDQDITRRWAAARVEEIALRGRGREAATDVALRAGLLTPWTGFLVNGDGAYAPTPMETRILDLAVGDEAGFSASFATPKGTFGALANVIHETEIADDDDKEDAFKAAVAAAARRVIEEAGAAVRACRDTRASLRPELEGQLDVSLSLDGDGHASDVKVRGGAGANDDALDRCVEIVVEGLIFPSSGIKVKVTVNQQLALPPPRSTLRARKCSPTSTLPLPLRRGVWRERLDRNKPENVYLDAKQSCELPTWTDRRALLELILLSNEDGLYRIGVARQLEIAGEVDAAEQLRREAVRRARSPEELHRIQIARIGEESYPAGAFKKQYNAAADDKGRLGVVRRFLGIAPHDARLRRRLLALLEALGMKQELAEEVRRFRLDPFADAGLLADGASALRRIGDEAEARRAFGELAERAPEDPWARAFLGDRLRNEGWFDDATLAYTVLGELLPDDPAAVLRLALGHAGAGRLDIAERMLARVAQTGGRAGDGRLGEMAGRLGHDLLAEARQKPGVAADDLGRLTRSALELPFPTGGAVILLRGPAGAQPIEVTAIRGPRDAREEKAPEVAAEGIGLYTLRFDPSASDATVLRLRRPALLAPAQPTRVRVDALVPDGAGKPPRLVTTFVELPITGKPIEVKWTGSAWSTG
ncbi:MAG: VIT domain-containing protein [Byssovorax sp.]